MTLREEYTVGRGGDGNMSMANTTTQLIDTLQMLMSMGAQRVVPFIQGPPGIGKSAIIYQIAMICGYVHFLDIRLSQHDSTDIKGIPYNLPVEWDKNGNPTKFTLVWIPPEFMPLEGSKYDDGKPGILFFDEINRAPIEVLQSVFEVVHDRRVGMRPILDNWFIIAAGNYGYEDGTDVVEMDSALKNRFQTIKLKPPNFKEWKNWAEPAGIHPMVLDFLEQYPDYLFYKDDGYDSNIITPRTWEKFSNVLNTYGGQEQKISEMMSHNFLFSISAQFNSFVREHSGVRVKDIVENYEGVKDEISTMDRHRIIELIDKMDQFVKNNSISDISGISNFFINHLTEDNQVTFISRLSRTNSGNVVLEKLLKANPDINKSGTSLAKKVEEAIKERE